MYEVCPDGNSIKCKPRINSNKPSKTHPWPYICLDILPPWFDYKPGCVTSPLAGSFKYWNNCPAVNAVTVRHSWYTQSITWCWEATISQLWQQASTMQLTCDWHFGWCMQNTTYDLFFLTMSNNKDCSLFYLNLPM